MQAGLPRASSKGSEPAVIIPLNYAQVRLLCQLPASPDSSPPAHQAPPPAAACDPSATACAATAKPPLSCAGDCRSSGELGEGSALQGD